MVTREHFAFQKAQLADLAFAINIAVQVLLPSDKVMESTLLGRITEEVQCVAIARYLCLRASYRILPFRPLFGSCR